MTQEEAQLIIDLLNVETALRGRGDRTSLLLAAALADYRSRLEKRSGFVRVQPDHTLESLKFIQVQRGNGWLKATDTRLKRKNVK